MHNTETITVFSYNSYALKTNMTGVSMEESLISPPAGNCINWIIGHIVVTRDEMLEEMGLEKICSDLITRSYISGSEAIKKEEAWDIILLLELYDKSQEIITKHLETLDLTDQIDKKKSYAGFAFHEAYHIGQIGILRRMLGKKALIK
ncbi:MAG TPA: hypothetical protein VGK25_01500 [Ignavibacteria bacterium]|jgi:hypothetical protein